MTSKVSHSWGHKGSFPFSALTVKLPHYCYSQNAKMKLNACHLTSEACYAMLM